MIIYTGNYTFPIAIMSAFRTKLYMQHLHSWFWFLTSYKRRLSNKRAPSSYERLTSKCSFHYKPGDYLTVKTLFDFLIPLAYLYWKWLVIITSIIQSILYRERWDKYELCKKSLHFCYHVYFLHKKAPQNTYVMCFHFFIFGHHDET